MHEDAHLCLGFGLHQGQRKAFLADSHRIARGGECSYLLDGQDEGGRDGSGAVG